MFKKIKGKIAIKPKGLMNLEDQAYICHFTLSFIQNPRDLLQETVTNNV